VVYDTITADWQYNPVVMTNKSYLLNEIDLLNKSIPLEKIMLRGGWKSKASAMRYLQSWNDSNWLIIN